MIEEGILLRLSGIDLPVVDPLTRAVRVPELIGLADELGCHRCAVADLAEEVVAVLEGLGVVRLGDPFLSRPRDAEDYACQGEAQRAPSGQPSKSSRML